MNRSVRDPDASEIRSILRSFVIPATFVAVFATGLIAISVMLLLAPHSWLHRAFPNDNPSGSIAFGVLLFFMTGAVVMNGRWNLRNRRRELAQLRADSLPQRAKHAAQVLQEATTLVEELQAELTARTALLEDVQRQVAETNERAADMERLDSVDDETTRVLNKYFDEALKHRLGELEHSARGREWLIGTVVAVAIGILAILFSHFVLGF